jgi:choline dehydrogenase-like flavoprotein
MNLSDYDAVVLGSGPSGIATTKALVEAGFKIALIDGGFDLDQSVDKTKTATVRYELGKQTPQKLQFGSDFATRRHPNSFIQLEDAVGGNYSAGVGGLSNVWGGCLFPFRSADISTWPRELQNIQEFYSSVLSYVPNSGAQNWPTDLLGSNLRPSPSAADRQIFDLVKSLSTCTHRGKTVEVVDSFLAVNNQSLSPSCCQQCGRCLSGCPSDSIFNSKTLIPELVRRGLTYIPGFYVTAIKESNNEVVLAGVLQSRPVVTNCNRLFLGGGPIVSTSLVMGALDVNTAFLNDCQAFTLPLLVGRWRPLDAASMSLAAAFIEMTCESDDSSIAHFQIYGRGPEFLDAARESLRRFGLTGRLSDVLIDRSLVAHGFLPPAESSKLVITKKQVSKESRYIVEVEQNSETKNQVKEVCKTLTRFMRPKNILPLSAFAHLEKPGGSYHLSSSFPIGSTHKQFSSDCQGRPGGLKRVHLVDASSLPEIPPQSPTLTVMAHATKIAIEVARESLI